MVSVGVRRKPISLHKASRKSSLWRVSPEWSASLHDKGMTSSLDPDRPFSRAEALKAGISPGALRSKKFRTIFRGIHISASVAVTPQMRAEAALRVFDRTAYASHATAARLYRVPIPSLPEEHITVLRRNHRRIRSGIVCHEIGRQPLRISIVRNLRVSAPELMFAELSDLLDLVNLVVVGDDLVRRGLTSVAALRSSMGQVTGNRGVKARRAAAYVRDKVDSPMETRLRLLLVLAGIPEPKINLAVRNVDGEPLRRFDLSWPEVHVIVEYDGRYHIEREEQWESDLHRREEIDDNGWRILVVTSSGIYRAPEETLLRVWRLLKARKLPGLPVRLLDQWRPHFPGQPRAA